MDSETRGVSGSAQEVAGDHRPFPNLVKSSMLPIFFSVPRSERTGHGCCAPELEWVAGVCLTSLVSNSSFTEKAPIGIWSPSDHHSSLLASETLVSGAAGSSGGRSCSSSAISRSFETTALPSSSSGSVGAVFHAWRLSSDLLDLRVSPCMYQSSPHWHVAHLHALVTRRSGLFIDSGVVRRAIPFLALLFLKWPIFCFGYVGPRSCLFLLFWATAPCCLRYFAPSFRRSQLLP